MVRKRYGEGIGDTSDRGAHKHPRHTSEDIKAKARYAAVCKDYGIVC
jgi:hypothetical protein